MNLSLPLPVDVVGFAALLARIGGFLATAPLVGARVVPTRWRVLLGIMAAVCLWSALPAHWQVPQPSGTLGLPYLALLIGGELLLGILASLILHILFEVFSFAGQVLGITIGFSFAQQLDPNLDEESCLMSVFMTQVLTVIFAAAGGLHLLLHLAVLSIQRFPPGGFAPSAVGMQPIVTLAGQIFAIGFQLALPVFCVSLFLEISLGLMTRFGEEFEVLMLAFPIRIAVGLFIMSAAIPIWVHLAFRLVGRSFGQVSGLLNL